MTAVLSTTQVVVPCAVGLVLLGDRLRPGWLPALLAGLGLTVGGITLLARRR